MKNLFLFSCLLSSFFLIGCSSTTQVMLSHETYMGPKANNPVIAVGKFTDYRKHGSNWLGAIRSGMGQPLKTLETPKAVTDMVRDAFQDALKQRGLYSDFDNAKYILNVDVIQYDCNQVTRREAHIKLDAKILVSATNQEVFSDHIVVDNVEFSMAGGVFGSVEDLKKLAEKTLSQAVKDAFNNPNLKKLYQQEQR